MSEIKFPCYDLCSSGGFQMNRQGHVGTILMVFGALLLVGVALFSFQGFKNNIKSLDSDFRGLSIEMGDLENIVFRYMETFILESIKQSKDSNNFEETFKIKLKELTKQEMEKNYFKNTEDKNLNPIKDNVFAKIVSGNFIVEKSGDKGDYVLSVKDLTFSMNTGSDGKSVNSIDYKFSITSKFNKTDIDYLSLG